MKKFAKIFDTPQGQVLLTKGWDNDADMDTLTQTTFLKDIELKTVISSKDRESIHQQFVDYKLSDALKFRRQMQKIMRGEDTTTDGTFKKMIDVKKKKALKTSKKRKAKNNTQTGKKNK